MRAKDITGMRSGSLTALYPTDKRQKGSVMWVCRCDCGKETVLPAYKILHGLTYSCGCARSEQRAADLTGQRFGKLTALYRTDKKRGSSYLWHCACDCGNTVDVVVSALRSGNTKSCGCLRTDTMLATLESHGTVQDHVHAVDGTVLEKLTRKKPQSNNSSGYNGVQPRGNRWIATIGFKGKHYYLGIYDKIEDAIQARKAAEELYYKPLLEDFQIEESKEQ